MRAVTFEQYGPPSVLGVAELAQPKPGPDEILIHVGAVEVTKSDCELRAMRFPVRWFAWPLRLFFGWNKPRRRVLGAYLSGRISALGERVTQWQVGDEVFGSTGTRFGGYAEFAVASASATLVKKPRNLGFAEAAAIPLGGLNALHFMNTAGELAGKRVLIIGAGGSIGSFALQIAKRRGAHVTAVDTAHKLAWLTSLGADRVVDCKREDALAAQDAYDVVFSTIAAAHYDRCLRALAGGGRYLTANPRLADMLRAAWTNSTSNKRVSCAFARETRAELESLRQMAEAGELTIVLDSVVGLGDAPAAHARVETEQRVGAVVLAVMGHD